MLPYQAYVVAKLGIAILSCSSVALAALATRADTLCGEISEEDDEDGAHDYEHETGSNTDDGNAIGLVLWPSQSVSSPHCSTPRHAAVQI